MKNKQKFRTIIFYKKYFQEFFVKQLNKVKDKIIWTFDLIEELPRVPETYLKHIENTEGLYEIRVQQGNDIFRIFCFFGQGQARDPAWHVKFFQEEENKLNEDRIKAFQEEAVEVLLLHRYGRSLQYAQGQQSAQGPEEEVSFC